MPCYELIPQGAVKDCQNNMMALESNERDLVVMAYLQTKQHPIYRYILI